VLDDAMLESLEELLIQADMGVDTAVRVTANIAEGRFGRRISTGELRQALAAEVAGSWSRWRGRCPCIRKSRRWCWWWG
jgi:signal recognition particle GTPase